MLQNHCPARQDISLKLGAQVSLLMMTQQIYVAPARALYYYTYDLFYSKT